MFYIFLKNKKRGGGGAFKPPPPPIIIKVYLPPIINKVKGGVEFVDLFINPLSLGSPFLKILNFSKLFVADAHVKIKFKNLVLLALRVICVNGWLIRP